MNGALKWSNEQTKNPKHLIQHLYACTYERENTVLTLREKFNE